MNVSDVHHGSKAVWSLKHVSLTGTVGDVDGEIIDTAGYGAGLLFFQVEDLTVQDIPIVLYESDDFGMAGATQVAADNILGNPVLLSGLSGTVVTRFGYIAGKRYMRPRVQAGAAVAVGVLVGAGILVNSFHQPTPEQ